MDGLDDHCDPSRDEPDGLSHHGNRDGRRGHHKNGLDDHLTDDLDGHCDPSKDEPDGLNHHGSDDLKSLMNAQGVNYCQIEDLSLGAMIVNGHHLVLHVS
jgi:hypothetical protein